VRLAALIAGGGILAAAAAALVGYRKAAAVEAATVAAVTAGGDITIRITGYWPASARPDEQKMEGGMKDRKGRPLHSVEDFLAGLSDHVSLSGDDGAWPYGQKLMIPWLDGRTLTGRVTDTGRNFRGSTKVYRAQGAEPIDVNVFSSKTSVPKPPIVTGRIIKGDTLDKPSKEVVVSKFQGQDVAVGRFAALGAL
jgi:hypothetical protein